MAFGLPVVASDGGALGELISNNGCGSLVPSRDPKAFADAIIRLIAANKTNRENGIIARATVQRFHPQRIAAETMELYQTVGGSISANGLGEY
jgi:glycosyltransferase involved in cell wall biosynthesis